MPETAVAQREQLPSIETSPPSPALKMRIAKGAFDTNQPIDATIPTAIDPKAFEALHNQNVAQRQKDAEKISQKYQNLSAEELQHVHMLAWSLPMANDIGNDLQLEGRGSKTANILAKKLHLPLTGDLAADHIPIQNAFYNADSRETGSFYKEFCTGNMSENLANALTVDDMMHLKTFLTKWMLGSETAFDALVALRQTKDDLESSDPTRKQQLAEHATAFLSQRDNNILIFFRDGLGMKPGEEDKKPAKNQQPDAAEPDKKQEQPSSEVKIGSKTEFNPEHPERNDDTYFLDKKKLRGGIFDGAGGYAGGNIASRTAQEAVQEVMAELSENSSEQEVRAAIVKAFATANEAVKVKQNETHNVEASTTAAVFQITQNPDGTRNIFVGNVGDSRIWIRRADGNLQQVTQDWGNLRIDLTTGVITSAQYEDLKKILDSVQTQADLQKLVNYPVPHALKRYFVERNLTGLLGADKYPLEIFKAKLEDGDMVFMTTDGVHDNLTQEQIEAVVRENKDPQALSQELVAQAKAVVGTSSVRAKRDDITAAGLFLPQTPTQANLATAA